MLPEPPDTICMRHLVVLYYSSGVGRGGERGLDAGSSSRVPVRVRIYFPVSRRSKPYGHDC